ncbi:MAG TPA: four helix bundle protein [Chryseolinea sp.]
MRDYRKLVVWEKAHRLVLSIYEVTKAFPREEQYGLTGQIRRAAASAPTNIAEGCGRHTQLDFAKHLQQAFGSIQEVQYLSFLSVELKYVDRTIYNSLDKDINEVKAMLISLIKKVRSKQNTQEL